MIPAALDNPPPPKGLYWLWLLGVMAAILAFFTALVIAFVERSQNLEHWQPVQLPSLLWLSTAVILASSATCEAARQCYRRARQAAYIRLLKITMTLGGVFLASQILSWAQFIGEGAFVRAHPFSAFFYMFTGLHGAHLAGGIAALGYLYRRTARQNSPLHRKELVGVVTLYWHFMGALWIALYMLLRIQSQGRL